MSAGDDILILLAAGSARRMQSVVDDKITALLAGKPVFVHSLQSFLSTGLIGRVVITYRDEAQLAKLKAQLTGHLPTATRIDFVPGGECRQDSVLAALKTCEEIDKLESDADRVMRSAMSKLFREEPDPVLVGEALAEGEAEKPKACEEAPHGSTLALLLEDEVSEAEKPGGPPPALWV